MTPQTLVIDRNFKGVGRIKRATGSTHGKVRAAMSRMLTELHQLGRLDILRAIRDGRLELLQVYDAYRRHAVNTLPTGGTLEPLGAAWTAFMENMDSSESYRRDYRTSLRHLLSERPDAKVADLPEILESLRNTLGKQHPRAFNMTKSHAGGFVRKTLKRSHPLWIAIGAVEKRKVVRQKKGNPLSPAQMREFFPDIHGNHDDAIAWGMATTGMGGSEYWGRWEVRADRVHIEGTKRKGRVRDVPLLLHPVVPRVHRRTWEDHIRKRFRGKLTPYDLRRTYANWLEAASVPRTRRKLYMGHSAGDVTGLYELHEVAAFLVEDGRKLLHLINLPTKPHTMRLETSA